MRPVLFGLGPLQVKAYGTFIALAFVAAWLVLRHELDRRGARADVAGRRRRHLRPAQRPAVGDGLPRW